ncbi:citryl-CoA lyase [Roseateles sp. BYS96W]|uniref:Citryl-CoA lyase n=1 Tax=Pelomonas nitida TaxID=3299027 RepID=A0ABW7G7W7_9BURK
MTSLQTRIWHEVPEPGDPFAVRVARCHGYDVFGDMLGHCRWVELLFLLFRGEAPSSGQAALLEDLAVALANPGPRDPAVHAAMASATGGATAAAALMAALAVGAGRQGGARDVFDALTGWERCGLDVPAWQAWMRSAGEPALSIWPAAERPAGFDGQAVQTSGIVLRTLSGLCVHAPAERLRWLAAHRGALEAAAGRPLAMTGVAAAVLADLGFDAEQGEMLHLLLRLPGAAAHALEQRALGYKRFPFPAVQLEDDPGQAVGAS